MLNDQQAREQAINPDHSFIVQAPAGSGKTELLTQRFLALLATVNSPEHIIAITFTRKASAEMKQRIISALRGATQPAPHPHSHQFTTWKLAGTALIRDKMHQWNLLTNTHRLRIMSFDSLAAALCSQSPILSGFDAQPAIIENPQEIYKKAAEQMILTLSDPSPWQTALQNLLLHLDNRVDVLQQLFINMINCREQWLPHIMNARSNSLQLKAILEKSLRHIANEKTQILQQQTPTELTTQLLHLVKHAAKNLNNTIPTHPICAANEIDIAEPIKQLPFSMWFAITHMLLTKTGDWRKNVDKRCGFPSDSSAKPEIKALLNFLQDNEILRCAFSQVQLCPPQCYSQSQWNILLSLLELLPLLTAQLHILFQQRQSIDFIELNLKALQALGDIDNPTDLSLYLDYRIQHLLIDEFQDTSILQFQILERLTAGWQAHDGRTLFLVGDPMQSIYRFRNAEVGLFLRAQTQPIGQIQCQNLQLTCNFRANKKLIDWINQRFTSLFPKQADIITGAVCFSPSVATQMQHTGAISFYPFFNGDMSEQAEHLTQHIKILHHEHPENTIAILVRSRSHLIEISLALQQAQLPFQAIEIMRLIEYTVVQDILTVARVLLHRADHVAWLALLRAPWCGLKLEDLLFITQHARNQIATQTLWQTLQDYEKISLLSQDAKKRLQRLVPILSHSLFRIREQSFSQVCYGCWLSLGGATCVSDKNELEQVPIFFAALRQIEQQKPITQFNQIEEQIENLFANASQSNAKIQIMTIHKSKGLEFDHVFLPALDKRTNIDPHQLLIWLERPNPEGKVDLLLAPIKANEEDHDPIYHYLRQIKQQQNAHELARLFYVACTRAKKSLYLSANCPIDAETKKVKSPSQQSFLQLIWSHYQEFISEMAAQIKTTEQPTAAAAEIKTKNTNLFRLPSNWINSNLPNDISTQPNFYVPNMSFENTIQLNEADTAAQLVGILVHQTLETIGNIGIEKWKQQPNDQHRKRWQQHIESTLGSTIQTSSIIQQIEIAIHNTLNDKKGRWILQAHSEFECEFAITTYQDHKTKQLIIDRTFIDENNKRWIIDYKTETPQALDLDLFLRLQQQQYAKQLQQYADALSQMDSRPIILALYFPLIPNWITWEYTQQKITEDDTHATRHFT